MSDAIYWYLYSFLSFKSILYITVVTEEKDNISLNGPMLCPFWSYDKLMTAGVIEKGNGLRLMLLALLNGQLMMDVPSITGFIVRVSLKQIAPTKTY